MLDLTSHERYEIYKHCLNSGISEDVAVKIRENATNTLSEILGSQFCDTAAGEVIIGAFDWDESPEGTDYWDNIFTALEKGEIK